MAMVTPIIVGRGMSGQALAKSFAVLSVMQPELGLAPPLFWERGRPLTDAVRNHSPLILGIANPHGLHAQTLLEATGAGIKNIILEKPVCVNADEVKQLRGVEANIAVLHGYRMLWGPASLAEMRGELGEIFAIEGRYWQSSAASAALSGGTKYAETWKGNPKVGGRYGVLLDLATHWIDLASFTAGARLETLGLWKTSILSDVDYLDTHVQLSGTLGGNIRLSSSISKVAHGATNDLEITLLGTKGSATWKFLSPDEIIWGLGRDRKVLTRKNHHIGLQQPAFHSAGWIDGFTEVCRQALMEMVLGKAGKYPRLRESLDILDVIFKSA